MQLPDGEIDVLAERVSDAAWQMSNPIYSLAFIAAFAGGLVGAMEAVRLSEERNKGKSWQWQLLTFPFDFLRMWPTVLKGMIGFAPFGAVLGALIWGVAKLFGGGESWHW